MRAGDPRAAIDYSALFSAALDKYKQKSPIPGYPKRKARSCWKPSCFSAEDYSPAESQTIEALNALKANVESEREAPIFDFLDRYVKRHGKISLTDYHFASYLLFELMRHDSVLSVQERYHKNPIYFHFSVVHRGISFDKAMFSTVDDLMQSIRTYGLTGRENTRSSHCQFAGEDQDVEQFVAWATLRNGLSSTKDLNVAKRFAEARSKGGCGFWKSGSSSSPNAVVVTFYGVGVDIEETLRARGHKCCLRKISRQKEVNVLSMVSAQDILFVEKANDAHEGRIYPFRLNSQSSEPADVLERCFSSAVVAPVPGPA